MHTLPEFTLVCASSHLSDTVALALPAMRLADVFVIDIFVCHRFACAMEDFEFPLAGGAPFSIDRSCPNEDKHLLLTMRRM
jgi:hypothetical protein